MHSCKPEYTVINNVWLEVTVYAPRPTPLCGACWNEQTQKCQIVYTYEFKLRMVYAKLSLHNKQKHSDERLKLYFGVLCSNKLRSATFVRKINSFDKGWPQSFSEMLPGRLARTAYKRFKLNAKERKPKESTPAAKEACFGLKDFGCYDPASDVLTTSVHWKQPGHLPNQLFVFKTFCKIDFYRF